MTKAAKFLIRPLGKHNRAAFHSGSKELDSYFLERASRDARENLSAVFVLVTEDDPDDVLGYYTLSSQEIDAGDLPLQVKKRLGRCKRIPATLLGRLAVAESSRGEGLGALLLIDALKRSLTGCDVVASFAVVVDAKTEEVVGFYRKHGFMPLSGNRLFLPMKTVEQLFPD